LLPVQLVDTGSIDVQVRSVADESLDGVRVYAIGSSNLPIGEVPMLSDGHARLGPLPADTYRVFARDGTNARVAAKTQAGSEQLQLSHAEAVSAAVVLEARRGSVHGRLIDASGRAIAAARITIAPHDRLLDPLVSQMLDSDARIEGRDTSTAIDGSFEIHGLVESGIFTLEVDQPTLGSAVRRNVRAGDEVELVLGRFRTLGLPVGKPKHP
jgi:hypothetical protein